MSNTATAKFTIAPNGDDAAILAGFDTYEEARQAALARSDHWLGIKMFGPSGKIATFEDGRCTGYLDGGTRRWVKS